MRMKKRALLDDRVAADFGSRRRRLRPRIVIGAAFLISIPLVATTFASQVTIKGAQGGAIEFGQGNQNTIVCDAFIQTSIAETWRTSESDPPAPSSDFYVNKIFLTDLDVNSDNLSSTKSNQGCGSKTLKVRLYGTSDAPIAWGNGSANLISFTLPDADNESLTLNGNGSGSHGITARLFNSSATVTGVTEVTSSSVTYTYLSTDYAAGYGLKIGDYVTISGISHDTNKIGCNFAGAYVSSVDAGSFSINRILTTGTGCATVSGITAKVYGKGVIEFSLPLSPLSLPATNVGRISLESN